MRIGFDARLYGSEHTGIGRYVAELLDSLIPLMENHQVFLFLSKKQHQTLKFPENVTKVPAEVRHYTIQEQFKMLALISSYNLDLIHFPHFNLPILYDRPFVLTIHDLLWHTSQGSSQTTLNPFVYALKYNGYKKVVATAISKSKAIITPSQYVADQIYHHYPKLEKKVTPIYEGSHLDQVDTQITSEAKKLQPYLLYVGSLYPHKNVSVLLNVLPRLPRELKLVVISSRSIFMDKFKEDIRVNKLQDRVVVVQRVSDGELMDYYSKAEMLVHPSLSEGFGLTGIEAMNLGTPVVCSNAGSLLEVYGEAAIYFDPNSPNEIVDKINRLLTNKELCQEMILKGKQRAKLFSWKKTARETMDIYETCLGI